MKKFLVKIGIALLIEFAIVFLCLTIIDGLGYSDSSYKRFTSNNSSALIVGSSRSAHGIQPGIIENTIYNTHRVYNFSDNVVGTPYGEFYFNQISEKIKNGINDGMGFFIVAVDPFVLAEDEIWDKHGFRENHSNLTGSRPFVKPNYRYLLKNCRPVQWTKSSIVALNDDGWLRVDFSNIDDSVIVKHNIELKIAEYSERKLHKSEYRKYWLCEIIKLFKSRGEVYMCRIPVSMEMKTIEDEQWPDFDADMKVVSSELNVPYFSFINDCANYRTTDGNHLYKDDGAKFTRALCDSIARYNSGI